MSREYSDETLATLTAEERAVILDDEVPLAEQRALAAIAAADQDDDDDEDEEDDFDDDEDDDDEGEDEEDDDDDGNVNAHQAAAAQEANARNHADEGNNDGRHEARFRSQYRAELPSDYAHRIDDLNARMIDLAERFKAGELEFDEFQAGSRLAELERTELIKAQTKAEIAAEMSQQSAHQEWSFLVKSFVKSVARDGGVDYLKDDVKRNDLDGFIKVLANNPANHDKEPEWFLEEAHKRVNALHGVIPARRAIEKTVSLQEVKQARKPALSQLPKSLSDVPGSDGPGDLRDEFAAIDALSGDQLEAAIARMSPAQREKFMSQA